MPHREKTLWVGPLYLMSGFETNEGVAKEKLWPELGIKLWIRVPNAVRCPLRFSLHPKPTIKDA